MQFGHYAKLHYVKWPRTIYLFESNDFLLQEQCRRQADSIAVLNSHSLTTNFIELVLLHFKFTSSRLMIFHMEGKKSWQIANLIIKRAWSLWIVKYFTRLFKFLDGQVLRIVVSFYVYAKDFQRRGKKSTPRCELVSTYEHKPQINMDENALTNIFLLRKPCTLFKVYTLANILLLRKPAAFCDACK